MNERDNVRVRERVRKRDSNAVKKKRKKSLHLLNIYTLPCLALVFFVDAPWFFVDVTGIWADGTVICTHWLDVETLGLLV